MYRLTNWPICYVQLDKVVNRNNFFYMNFVFISKTGLMNGHKHDLSDSTTLKGLKVVLVHLILK